MWEFDAEYLRETRRGMWADSREALSGLELDRCERILDVGCGEGALTRVLRDECPGEVVGCDRDARLLAEMEGPTVQGDTYRLPFTDDSFDLVVCQALLINLSDPARAVREFARVARDRIACIEPDNGAVAIESSVDTEGRLAEEARRRYLEGIETNVELGADAVDLLRDVGLSNVRVVRYDQVLRTEAPYTDADVRAVSRKASGAGLRDRRETMVGSEEALDALRADWREMGREAARQLSRGEYRRIETVPFYVTVGEL